MPPQKKKNIETEDDSLDRLKSSFGIQWSGIIKWLVGLIPISFGAGISIGVWATNISNKAEINSMELKHQKELYQATKEATKEARAEVIAQYKEAAERAQSQVQIIREVTRK